MRVDDVTSNVWQGVPRGQWCGVRTCGAVPATCASAPPPSTTALHPFAFLLNWHVCSYCIGVYPCFYTLAASFSLALQSFPFLFQLNLSCFCTINKFHSST
jgi:hypothetical protein